MTKIGIVEDDLQLNTAIKLLLEKANYEVYQAHSCKEARLMLNKQCVDILLLDINLPDGSGFSICEEFSHFPVIFLTARDDEYDIIKAYDEGCEDYVVKPFSMKVLLKRIEVVLRRTKTEPSTYTVKDLILDVDRRECSIHERIIKLTVKEFDILYLLMRNQNRVITKETILATIWDCDERYVDESSVTVTISRLRKKLSEDPKAYITNVFGSGYRMETTS